MKSIIFLLTSCVSIFAIAGFGGIGGGSSNNSINANELTQLLNSTAYNVRVPQIAFGNPNNSTTYVSIDQICRTENSLQSIQDIVLVKSKTAIAGVSNIATVKLQRSLILDESRRDSMPLVYVIEIYKSSSVRMNYDNAPIYLESRIYTIPNCN